MIKRIFNLLFFLPIFVGAQTAFISGNETVCDNAEDPAIVKVDFLGNPPFTFVYAINGVAQQSIITQNTPYLIATKTAGIYTLDSFSDAISPGDVNASAKVTILQAPEALIHIESDTLSVLYPTVDFISQSSGNIISQTWNFGDNTPSIIQNNPTHTYPLDANGLGIVNVYEAFLIVESTEGCSDTARHQILVRDEYWMYIPSAFTPDNDTKNDKYCIEYNAIKNETFLFKVYNIQGELMFQTSDLNILSCRENKGWDGRHYRTGINLPMDTYIYEVYFQDFEGWKYKDYGTIILIR